ncbi:NOT2/NOT3/NOT5 family protein [Spraguea lophii 42_110]|uniref:NOT2/NOT3/NOT5 family protein n=1 Tax=Spraguea lophii (strain 42_110) TaxID=1358809 RepID=S7XJY9_SPRLO|nr:NOT2/NOT3/NOT5 family protein [Spraguea lophii 42_110]
MEDIVSESSDEIMGIKESLECRELPSFPLFDYNNTCTFLPRCYDINVNVDINFNKVHEDTLFYIFYNITGSDIQIKAYIALLKRDYKYSIILQQFIQVNNMEYGEREIEIEVFDHINWKKEKKIIIFDKIFVENLKTKANEVLVK